MSGCVALLALACGREPEGLPLAAPPPTAADRARAEFEGAYPFEPSPSGTVREFEIVAAPSTHVLGSGEPTRVWAYNGTVPGPTLRIRLGDTLRVKFRNELPAESTIHWHGMRVPKCDGRRARHDAAARAARRRLPTDAGAWMMHCHILEHAEAGMMTMIDVVDA